MLNSIVALYDSGVAGAVASYESIATATGTGSSGTITFSSIPATYKSLQLRINAQDNTVNTYASQMRISFNNDATANYASHRLLGNGTAASAVGNASATYMTMINGAGGGGKTNCYASSIIDIHDYASTSNNKTIRNFNGFNANQGTADDQIGLGSGLWINTAAVNRIDLVISGASYTTGSTFALYGIKG